MFWFVSDAVVSLEVRDEVFNEVSLEGCGVVYVESVGAGGRGVAVGHDDEHRDGVFLRDEIVEDDIGTTDVRPGVFGIAASMEQEHYGEFCVGVFVVTGGRVDVERSSKAECLRLVGVDVEHAVRDVLLLEEQGFFAADLDEAL